MPKGFSSVASIVKSLYPRAFPKYISNFFSSLALHDRENVALEQLFDADDESDGDFGSVVENGFECIFGSNRNRFAQSDNFFSHLLQLLQRR